MKSKQNNVYFGSNTQLKSKSTKLLMWFWLHFLFCPFKVKTSYWKLVRVNLNETTQLRIGRRKVYRGKLGRYIEMINEPKSREGKKRRKVGHSTSMLSIILWWLFIDAFDNSSIHSNFQGVIITPLVGLI